MVVDIELLVHPIDVEKFPTVPPGWRWAVMVSGPRPRESQRVQASPADMSRCPNAGWCPSLREALLEGEQNASTALKAFRMVGIPAEAHKQELDYDPIPAYGDVIERVR